MSETDGFKTLDFSNTEIAFASRSNFELRKMYWVFSLMNDKKWNDLSISLLQKAMSWNLPVKPLIRYSIFDHFCGGETIEDCQRAIMQLEKYKIGTILDFSVEGEKNETGFDAVTKETIATIEKAKGNKAIPFSVFKVSGISPFALLEKITSGEPLSVDEKMAQERVEIRLDAICKKAFENKVKIFFDAEESWIQGAIDKFCYQMMERYNKTSCIIYNTYQLYRWDILPALQQAWIDAHLKGYFLGAKLVRGAYMEKEAERAANLKYANPIQADKASTDEDFDKALQFCIKHVDTLHFCAGTHNEASTKLLANLMHENEIEPKDERIYFAQLYGMSDNISFGLAKGGYNVAKYVPYGPVYSVMPYLVRRASENTSIAGQTSRELTLIKTELYRRGLLKQ